MRSLAVVLNSPFKILNDWSTRNRLDYQSRVIESWLFSPVLSIVSRAKVVVEDCSILKAIDLYRDSRNCEISRLIYAQKIYELAGISSTFNLDELANLRDLFEKAKKDEDWQFLALTEYVISELEKQSVKAEADLCYDTDLVFDEFEKNVYRHHIATVWFNRYQELRRQS